MSELIGQTLGQYKITGLLSKDGMALVYRATQISMKRDVAIKVMSSDLGGDPEFVTRFEREAELLAVLQHPYIVPVLDFGHEQDRVYIVMRLVEGDTLDQRISKKGALPLSIAAKMIGQIGNALTFAHSKGILHRNLKPNNILLDANENASLTDFGIVKMLTRANSGVIGTPAYMSPEQAQGYELDGRSDIYSLGVVIYEMLTARRPFEGDTPYSIAVMHVTKAAPSPRVHNPDFPVGVEKVVLKALEKGRENRFQSGDSLAEAFRVAVEGREVNLAKSVTPSPIPREQLNTFGGPGSGRSEAAPRTFNKLFDVFLSYSRKDLDSMQKTRDFLRANDLKVWTDEALELGTPAWEKAIEQAIETTATVVVILTPDSKQSIWVGRELSYAEEREVRIFPLLVRGDPPHTAIPLRLTSTQRIDARNDFNSAIQKLISAVRRYCGLE